MPDCCISPCGSSTSQRNPSAQVWPSSCSDHPRQGVDGLICKPPTVHNLYSSADDSWMSGQLLQPCGRTFAQMEQPPELQEWVVSVIDDLLERADLAIDEARTAITAKPGASLLVRSLTLTVTLTLTVLLAAQSLKAASGRASMPRDPSSMPYSIGRSVLHAGCSLAIT